MIFKTVARFKGIERLVDTVDSGEGCLLKAKNGLNNNIIYSLVLMDLSMPNMDGYECTEQLREIYEGHQQPKIIAVTGHCEAEYIAKAWRHDIDEMISKPLQSSVLEQILQELYC